MGKRQLNILQVISGKTWSGGQQQTLHLLTGLRKRGHNSILACPSGSQLGYKAISSMQQLYRVMKEERVDVVNALMFQWPINYPCSQKCLPKYLTKVEKVGIQKRT